jgi:4,5-DOPA dioxygenase extradiol
MQQHTAGRMPAIFLGHGSPMNALDQNIYTDTWARLGAALPRPNAILVISAHWVTRGTAVTAMAQPKTIHDFGGFPQALFDMRYPAPGDPVLAARVQQLLAPEVDVRLDQDWGLDHGAWSVLVKAYPQADVPVLQLSIDASRPTSFHFALGRKLAALRDAGVLIVGSGNVVHNLRRMVWDDGDARPPYDWALRFNDKVRGCLQRGELASLAEFAEWGDDARLAVPSDEHYLPLLYVAGSCGPHEAVSIAVDGMQGGGAISMLSFVVGELRG